VGLVGAAWHFRYEAATGIREGLPGWLMAAWVSSFFLALVLLRGFGDNTWLPLVETSRWGGLLLTFLLAVVGIVSSFPLGVLLALGRRSNLPVARVLSILFIELVRGVPLVTLLFMTQIILPLFLPEDIRIDRVLRAFLAITLFSAAYMAENVRGGLQSVPAGQVEAARALRLNGPRVMLFIVLPQALRAIIPVIVGQFISLFKDTSLVVIVGLLDIVGIGKSIILGNVEWIGSQREVYAFIAAVFWVFTFSMSYASRRLEAALGVGKR
jgi:general L-amino acid transport system permease protein